jgi:hypothetical protein
VRTEPGCLPLPPSGLPSPPEGFVLPADLARFYEQCGGMELFTDADFPVAASFTELLRRLTANRGRHWYWLEPDFVDLGDAYD